MIFAADMTLNVPRSGLKAWMCQGARLASVCFPSPPSRGQCKELSSYNEVPRATHLPLVGSLPYFIGAGGQSQLHKYADRLHKKLGPVFVDKLIGYELLFVSDPDANLKVYKSEGPHPEHIVLDAWKLYLEESGQKRGLFFMDGEEWYKNRHILNKIILRPKSMENHVQQISAVCKDLMQIWKTNPPGDKLEYHLYSWNIECIGEIALGSRLGFLGKLGSPTEALKDAKHAREDELKDAKHAHEDEFVKAIHDTFLESARLYLWPARLARKLQIGSWKRFHSAVEKSLQIGTEYVERGIADCSQPNPRAEMKNSIIYKLLKHEKMGKQDLTSLLVDLFLASADTSSHTACWALYWLGRNPEVAQRARKEIEATLEEDGQINFTNLNNLSYIKGIIKETMRLTPIAMFLTRKLSSDVSLCGYSVPAGTMVISSIYSMGRDPINYSDPDSFLPERWFRSSHGEGDCPMAHSSQNNDQHLNKKAYVPWGIGGRSCVGKRIAELELSLLIVEALLAFDWTVKEDIDLVLRLVPVPSKNVELNLKAREVR